jgi:serine/threonine-protein kinase
VKVKFELVTAGAKVTLISEGEKNEEVALSFRGNKADKTLDTSKKWTVEAELKGYEPFSKTVDFDGADKELDFVIELTKESEAPAPPPLAGPVGPSPTPGPTPEPVPQPASDFGYINANSRPPSKVIIDGRPMGGTPVMGFKVKAGSHSIVFKHPELGTRSTSVTVAGGETKTASVVFKSAEPKPKPKKKK